MIAQNFTFYRPESVAEALEARRSENGQGGVFFLSGGTELVTMARDNVVSPRAVIDLKAIPETRALDEEGGELHIGASVTLTELIEWGRFPLLSAAAAGVADKTVRNSVTLGGNIAGRLPYRESVLPLLVAEGVAFIAGPDGERNAPLTELFSKRLRLGPEEFIISVTVPSEAAAAPWVHRRKTKDSRIDYPIMTLCAARLGGSIRFAVSGVHGYPLRSAAAEEAIRTSGGDPGERAHAGVRAIDARPKDDFRASGEYRQVLFTHALTDAVEELS
jgi:xanthine dehydrogenase molybdenum-binding subunit